MSERRALGVRRAISSSSGASSAAVRAAMIELLEREGITNKLLARRIREGLDATIVLRAKD